MEPEGSLPHSQVPATCPYPEVARSSPYPHIPLLEYSTIIISHLGLGLLSGLFPSGFPIRTLYRPVFSRIGSRNSLIRNVQMLDSIFV